MELDSFLATPRWDILKIIIQKPSSPIEISEQLQTTTSFVSQQLKLLEATGLVKKEKTGAFEKGKPRALFSISKESLYLIPLAKNAPDKKLISLSEEQKVMINIWCLENKKIENHLQKFFWQIQDNLEEIKLISVYTKASQIKIYILSEDSTLTHKINEVQKNSGKKIAFQVVSSASALEKLDGDQIFPIYVAPEVPDEINLKGGLKRDE